MLLCSSKAISLPRVKVHAYEWTRAILWMDVAQVSGNCLN